MITMFLDRTAKMPLYEQICRHIRGEIENGTLAAGTRIPSKRELAVHLETSPVTVETAYAQLVAEGYLSAISRSGHFVMALGAKLSVCFAAVFAPITETRRPQPEFDLSTGAFDTSLFPYAVWAKLAREVLAGSPEDLLSSGPPQGSLALRKEISRYLSAYRGITADPSQIVVGAGSEYLTGLLVQLFGRNTVYAVEDPGYPKIARIVGSNGGTAVKISLDEAGIDIGSLRFAAAGVVHVTPSHQFPTGIVMPVGRRRELLAWAAEKADRFIIEDDYDSEFRFAGQPIPALQGLDPAGRVVYLNSFTKSLAPALRVSYMVLPQELLAKFRAELGHYACTVSNIEQETLARFMAEERFERHLARMRNSYRLRRDALLDALSQAPFACRIRIESADAGLHFLLSIDGVRSDVELVDRAMRYGVRLAALSAYGGTTTGNVLVVGYGGLAPERATAAVGRLAAAWAE